MLGMWQGVMIIFLNKHLILLQNNMANKQRPPSSWQTEQHCDFDSRAPEQWQLLIKRKKWKILVLTQLVSFLWLREWHNSEDNNERGIDALAFTVGSETGKYSKTTQASQVENGKCWQHFYSQAFSWTLWIFHRLYSMQIHKPYTSLIPYTRLTILIEKNWPF